MAGVGILCVAMLCRAKWWGAPRRLRLHDVAGAVTTAKAQQGVTSSMDDTAREVGSAAGIALMGSIAGNHYRSALPDYVAQLPTEAAESVRHSAAAGLQVADQLGAPGAVLANGVKSAFTPVDRRPTPPDATRG
ncbi:hypothetical protein [Streptomyces tibetensis]|uniref:hypothetical protein n=1 Tax=Streptomyces tibetensis TaxID=2382123 RepID=UPI0033C9B2AC